MKESRSRQRRRRNHACWRPISLEPLETRHLLAAVPFGDQQIIDELDADGPTSVVSSDIDGDGDLDLVIGSFRDGNVAWHENDGTGDFERHLIDTVAGADVFLIREIVAADLDGDGDDDVAVAAYGSDRVIWYRNLGQGQFGSLETVSSETDGVRTVAAADLDKDGDLDLLSGSWIDNKVAWYENDGNGGFGQQQIISETTAGPRHVRVGDIDQDGLPDLAVAFRFDDTVAWFANQGDGTFGNPQLVSTVTNGPEAVSLADADGDGDLDLFTAFYFADTVAWFENQDGGGNFGEQQNLSTTAAGARFVAVADLDGDGDNDVAATSNDLSNSEATWFENTDGQGGFAPGKVISNKLIGVESLAIADLNGDETLDVTVASSDDNRVSWFANDGDASFGIPNPVLTQPVGLSSVDTADFDGDGDLDLLVGTSSDNRVAWYENVDGTDDYASPRIISAQANNVQKVLVADIDGDGDMDAVSASYGDNKIAWYENVDGLGNFGAQQIISRQSVGAIDVHTADLDGDGDQDVVSASASDGIIAWYRNEDGKGDFGVGQILTRRAITAEWVTTADLDGDGDNDILSAAYGDGRIAWYENEDSQGSFSSAKTIATGEGSATVEATDIDGDGDLDLVATQFGAGGLLFWIEQTDDKVFSDMQVIAIGFTRPEALIIADVDGDGKEDIVIADDRQVAWFERTENGFADHLVTLGDVEGVFDLAVADIDGDGDTDIVSASAYDSKLAFYENNSSTGDFDSDGNVDEADIALLCAAIHGQADESLFDLNSDGILDEGDLDALIEDVLQTSAGDANLDGLFNTADLVLVFQEGQYEDDVDGNSLWSQGDWNCDGEFDSSDLVDAFKTGQFELAPPPSPATPSDLASALLWQDSDEQSKRQRST